MGRFVAKRRRGKMKTILALALAALAAAEPEADADAYYGYGYGLGGYYGGYRTYGLGYGHGLYYGVYSAHHAVAPVVSYAHAPVVSHAVHAVAPVVSSYAQVSPSASLSTVGVAPAAIPAVEEPTLVPDATSPTPPEPSMLPRGRLRLTPTTTEDTVSDTGPTEDTEDTASDTAVATSTVRFCLDVLDLDATMLPTFCPWIGPTRI